MQIYFSPCLLYLKIIRMLQHLAAQIQLFNGPVCVAVKSLSLLLISEAAEIQLAQITNSYSASPLFHHPSFCQ